MKDIADELNVSVVTVSKVLRNRGDMSPATRERILKRARELNYRPNLAARSLVTGRTHMIALVVPDLVYPFFGHIARSVSRVIRPKGYTLAISSSEDNPELEREEIENLLSRQFDALILASCQTSAESDVFRRIEERKVPYVLVDRFITGLQASYVGSSDKEIGLLATQHLIRQGRKKIAHIHGPSSSGRSQGYISALHKGALEVNPQWQIKVDSTDDHGFENGFSAMRTLLMIRPKPDAVFCHNDTVAVGAMKAILAAGLRVPEDVALIGAANIRHSDMFRVSLSTIDQNSEAIGEKAARIVLKLIEDKQSLKARRFYVPVQLVIRDSSGRPR